MKTVLVAVLASICVITSVRAQDTCKIQADGKNLHGAAFPYCLPDGMQQKPECLSSRSYQTISG